MNTVTVKNCLAHVIVASVQTSWLGREMLPITSVAAKFVPCLVLCGHKLCFLLLIALTAYKPGS